MPLQSIRATRQPTLCWLTAVMSTDVAGLSRPLENQRAEDWLAPAEITCEALRL